MNLPLIGPLPLSGFANAWFFLYLFIVAGLVALYIAIQRARRRQVLRFANMEVLDSVAPKRGPGRWRHVPVALLIASLAVLTTAMAGPTHDIRVPQNRATVILVIDVSESMVSTDVAPTRLDAARAAGKHFADELTPGINLGLVAFGGTASLLAAPTTNREVVKESIDSLQAEPRTATGEGIFTALQAIAAIDAVMGGGEGPPPARIVLESDGKETVPTDPDAPRGAFTAARAAKEQGVPISTISFGTPDGYIDFDGQRMAVPVDDETLQKITEISGGHPFHAASLSELDTVYATLQQQIGYQVVRGDASVGWMRLGAVLLAAAVFAAVLLHRRLPG